MPKGVKQSSFKKRVRWLADFMHWWEDHEDDETYQRVIANKMKSDGLISQTTYWMDINWRKHFRKAKEFKSSSCNEQ